MARAGECFHLALSADGHFKSIRDRPVAAIPLSARVRALLRRPRGIHTHTHTRTHVGRCICAPVVSGACALWSSFVIKVFMRMKGGLELPLLLLDQNPLLHTPLSAYD